MARTVTQNDGDELKFCVPIEFEQSWLDEKIEGLKQRSTANPTDFEASERDASALMQEMLDKVCEEPVVMAAAALGKVYVDHGTRKLGEGSWAFITFEDREAAMLFKLTYC